MILSDVCHVKMTSDWSYIFCCVQFCINESLLPNCLDNDNDNNEATEISANQADMGMIGIRHQTLGWEYHIIRANNRTLPIMGAT